MMATDNQKNVVGEFISVNEACRLLENCREVNVKQFGLLSLHHVQCDVRGSVVLVQGGNGEFAVIKQAS